MFAAMVTGNAAVLMWWGVGIFTVLALLWMFYMMTFRPDDWHRLVQAEEERKKAAEDRREQRAKRLGNAVKEGMKIAELILKKK
jgi:fatty acid desaturase